MNAIYECFRLFAFGRNANALSHFAVGEEHKFLHELVGIFRFLEIHVDWATALIDVEAHLTAVEFHRAILEARLAHNLGKTVEGEHLVGVFALSGFDDFLSFLVGEAAVALYYGAADVGSEHAGVVVHLHDARECQFFLVGAQRAHAVAQALGEHWHGAVNEIDRCGSFLGFLVDDSAGLHIVSDVGNVDTHLPVAVGQFLN